MALAGWGAGPWGLGPFGEWRWSKATLFELIPEPYRELDKEQGNLLETFMEGISGTFDVLRHKIRDLGDLRDPLKAQSAYTESRLITLGKRVLDPAVIEQRGLDGKVTTTGTFSTASGRFTASDVGKELVTTRSKVTGNNKTARIISVLDQNTLITDPGLLIDSGLIRWEIRKPPAENPDYVVFEVDGGDVEDVTPGWLITDGLGEFEILNRTRFEKDTTGVALLTRTGSDAQIDANGRLITRSALLTPKDIGKYCLILESATNTNNGRHEIVDVDSVSVDATGMIRACAGSFLVDGQTFTLSDGTNPPVVFEFDNNASVTGGNVAVLYTNAMTAADVRDAIVTAITGAASLNIAATASSSTDVSLVNDSIVSVGAVGNVGSTTTVTAPQFSISGMFGGLTEYRAVFSRIRVPGITTTVTIPGSGIAGAGSVQYTNRLITVPDNRVSVRHVASNSPGVTVTVQGNAVTVTFEKNVSTAANIVTAVNASTLALSRLSAVVSVAGTAGSHEPVFFLDPSSSGTVIYETKTGKSPVRVRHILHGYNTVLSVSVIDQDITVNLATNQYGVPTSTAIAVAAAVNANVTAAALVVAASAGTGTGIAGPTLEYLDIPHERLVEDTHDFNWAMQPVARLIVKGPAITRGISEQNGTKGSLVSGVFPVFTTTEASFTGADVGKLISVQGSTVGNEGFYRIHSLRNINSVLLEGTVASESTSALIWDLRAPTLVRDRSKVEIHTQSFLQYLARDFGLEILKNETEDQQRRWVKNISKWAAEKGSSFGYEHLAASGSFDVDTRQLYGISVEQSQLIRPERLFEIGENTLGTAGYDGTLSFNNGQFIFSSPAAQFSDAYVEHYLRVQSYDAIKVLDSIASVPSNEMSDAEFFIITNSFGTAVTFEFDSNNSVSGSNTPIIISTGMTSTAIRDALITAVNSKQSVLGLAAKAVSPSVVALEPIWSPTYSLTTAMVSSHFSFVGQRSPRIYKIQDILSPTQMQVEPAIYGVLITATTVASITDGGAFTLDDGINPRKTFEFDTVPNGVVAGNIAINVSGLVTSAQVRDAVYTVLLPYCTYLNELDFRISKVGVDKLKLVFKGQPKFEHEILTENVGGSFVGEDVLEIDFDDSYTFTVPAVPTPPSDLDANIFIISDIDNYPRIFEYDLAASPSVGTGNIPINFTAGMTAQQIRDATVSAINSTGTTFTVGTGTLVSSGVNVTGTGTSFGTEFVVGAKIQAAGQTRTVVAITSTTALQTDLPFLPVLAAAAFTFGYPLDATATAVSSNSFTLTRDSEGVLQVQESVLLPEFTVTRSATNLTNLQWNLVRIYTDVKPERPLFDEFNPDVFAEAAQEIRIIDVPKETELLDGETFTINDGINAPTTFEFNKVGPYGGGNIEIVLISGWTADQVRNAVISAINGVGSTLLVRAYAFGSGKVGILKDTGGNITLTDTVDTSQFSVRRATFDIDALCGSGDSVDYCYAALVNTPVPKGINRYRLDVTGRQLVDSIGQLTSYTPEVVVDPYGWEVQYLDSNETPILTHYTEAGPYAKAGIITAVAGSLLTDGQTFTVNDGINGVVTFEFDNNAVVSGTNIPVTFTGGDAASVVATSIATAINSVGDELLAVAVASGSTVTVTLDNPATTAAYFMSTAPYFISATGTISNTGTAVTGVGTSFTTELSVGDKIKVGTQTRTVVGIGSNLSLTTDFSFNPVLSAAVYQRARTAFKTETNVWSFDTITGTQSPDTSLYATTGTGTISSSGTTVTGVGTVFLTQLSVGSKITADGQTRTVTAIAGNLSLTVDLAFDPVLSADIFVHGTLGYRLKYRCSTVFECDYCGASRMWISVEDGPYVNAFSDRLNRIIDGTPAHVTYFMVRKQTSEVEQEHGAIGTTSLS